MSLTRRLRRERDDQAAVARKADRRLLPRLAARMLQKAGDAEAAPPARLLRSRAARREAGDIREAKRLVQNGLEVAAVIGRADRAGVGQRARRDHISPSQRDAVDAGLPRRRVRQPLERQLRLRLSLPPLLPDLPACAYTST